MSEPVFGVGGKTFYREGKHPFTKKSLLIALIAVALVIAVMTAVGLVTGPKKVKFGSTTVVVPKSYTVTSRTDAELILTGNGHMVTVTREDTEPMPPASDVDAFFKRLCAKGFGMERLHSMQYYPMRKGEGLKVSFLDTEGRDHVAWFWESGGQLFRADTDGIDPEFESSVWEFRAG